MQFRKICNHPFVFEDIKDEFIPYEIDRQKNLKYYGPFNDMLFRTAGKFELLDRMLPKLFTTKHRVIIFLLDY